MTLLTQKTSSVAKPAILQHRKAKRGSPSSDQAHLVKPHQGYQQSAVGATVAPANVTAPAAEGTPAAAPAALAPRLPDGLPPDLTARYTINPHMLARFDEHLAERIVAGIEPRGRLPRVLRQQRHQANCQAVYAECDELGGTESRLIVDEINAMSSRRLGANTTASFSKYCTDYVRLNNSLHTSATCAATTTSLRRTTRKIECIRNNVRAGPNVDAGRNASALIVGS